MNLKGVDLFQYIQNRINGRIAMSRSEADLFYSSVTPGCLYIEIGLLWGGSAIFAAHQARHVISIDPMLGWVYDSFKYESPPTKNVLDNMTQFGVAHKISLVKAKSQPWPLPEKLRPDVLYIDGDHSYETAAADWRVASEITRTTILAHDYNRSSPGAKQMIDNVAMKDDKWKLTETANAMVRFDRVTEV